MVLSRIKSTYWQSGILEERIHPFPSFYDVTYDYKFEIIPTSDTPYLITSTNTLLPSKAVWSEVPEIVVWTFVGKGKLIHLP